MKNLLHEVHDYQPVEAIDLARAQLDFSAMATGAPSVKQVLFKAQTMGPLGAKPSPLKITAAAAATVACLGAICLPWIPLDSSFSSTQAGFEHPVSAEEAMRLVSKLNRSVGGKVIVSSDYEAVDTSRGRLRVNFTAVDVKIGALEQACAASIEVASAGELQPLFTVGSDFCKREWKSPLSLGLRYLDGKSHAAALSMPHEEAQQTVDSILGSEELIGEALDVELRSTNRGYKLKGLAFCPQAQLPLEGGFDFILPAWPYPVALQVDPYASLTSAEQSEIQAMLAALIKANGLGPQASTAALTSVVQLPITVQVMRSDGTFDKYLTDKLQSFVVQPSREELAALSFEPEQRIEQAIARAFPGIAHGLDFGPAPKSQAAADRRFVVSVELGGDASASDGARVRHEVELPSELKDDAASESDNW